ncbi:MAG: von Willebrand factor type A domain-containing protein [Petrimonas sp.]|uniref:vWA domain-containing protein n=1 Tax=Petrimonas sp. TaxID=2023866 RepID=UPI002B3C9137|nr:von Willebrand factor type A domain-containing protein [Petrimonas sp.]MEA4997532.1 von Willebrand factor type A domain-containing protein [Petrimonas sp.]MEA5045694.1 von Willebrand factor type A domain-containing protein [Petrimonas sp.]
MKTTLQRIGMILFMTGFIFSVWAQEMEVSGTVYDAQDKSPLVGVAVQVKGTQNGTVTDVNGRYRIKVEKGNTLSFLYIGYLVQEIKVKKVQLDVYLKPNKVALDEVVVVAFGTQKREAVVGSVMAVDGPSYYRSPFYSHEVNTEEYGSFRENRFLSVTENPLSTFALDVDAASYGNIRRIINQGQMPVKDAVRIEEMINYFSYDYPQPSDGYPVRIVTETAVCPWNKRHNLVRIGVKAKEIPSETLPASNFVFLLDVSGSMFSANKLPLVKASMKLLVNNLRPKDRIAIVTYAGAAGEVLPSTSASDKQKIIEALDNLQAGGSTAGGAGIQLAYKIAEKNLVKGGNNRVILCTDGDFNVGVSSPTELESLIESKQKSGVFLTVLGYGMGNYKDNKLQTLAQKGNGNHAYIDNLQEANKVLVNEFGSTMYAVAKDVKLQMEFNPNFVNAYRLIGYESRLLNDEDFNDDSKDAGELGAGHTVTALYEIVPVGVDVPVGSVDKLKYQQTKNDASLRKFPDSKELLTVKLRYKEPDKDVSRKLEVPVPANKVNVNVSPDFNFAMAAALFGQLLRDSDFTGNAKYSDVINLARKGLGNDPNGYRHEFIRLVEAVEQLEK